MQGCCYLSETARAFKTFCEEQLWSYELHTYLYNARNKVIMTGSCLPYIGDTTEWVSVLPASVEFQGSTPHQPSVNAYYNQFLSQGPKMSGFSLYCGIGLDLPRSRSSNSTSNQLDSAVISPWADFPVTRKAILIYTNRGIYVRPLSSTLLNFLKSEYYGKDYFNKRKRLSLVLRFLTKVPGYEELWIVHAPPPLHAAMIKWLALKGSKPIDNTCCSWLWGARPKTVGGPSTKLYLVFTSLKGQKKMTMQWVLGSLFHGIGLLAADWFVCGLLVSLVPQDMVRAIPYHEVFWYLSQDLRGIEREYVDDDLAVTCYRQNKKEVTCSFGLNKFNMPIWNTCIEGWACSVSGTMATTDFPWQTVSRAYDEQLDVMDPFCVDESAGESGVRSSMYRGNGLTHHTTDACPSLLPVNGKLIPEFIKLLAVAPLYAKDGHLNRLCMNVHTDPPVHGHGIDDLTFLGTFTETVMLTLRQFNKILTPISILVRGGWFSQGPQRRVPRQIVEKIAKCLLEDLRVKNRIPAAVMDDCYHLWFDPGHTDQSGGRSCCKRAITHLAHAISINYGQLLLRLYHLQILSPHMNSWITMSKLSGHLQNYSGVDAGWEDQETSGAFERARCELLDLRTGFWSSGGSSFDPDEMLSTVDEMVQMSFEHHWGDIDQWSLEGLLADLVVQHNTPEVEPKPDLHGYTQEEVDALVLEDQMQLDVEFDAMTLAERNFELYRYGYSDIQIHDGDGDDDKRDDFEGVFDEEYYDLDSEDESAYMRVDVDAELERLEERRRGKEEED